MAIWSILLFGAFEPTPLPTTADLLEDRPQIRCIGYKLSCFKMFHGSDKGIQPLPEFIRSRSNDQSVLLNYFLYRSHVSNLFQNNFGILLVVEY